MNKSFSTKEAISYAWKTWKTRKGFFIGVGFLSLITSAFSNVTSRIDSSNSGSANSNSSLPLIISLVLIVISLLLWVASRLVEWGKIKVYLKTLDRETPAFSEIFQRLPLFGRYLWAWIRYTFIVIVGYLLLLVPGIIWSIKYQFYPYIIHDQGISVGDAFKRSAQLTEGIKWRLLWFGFVLAILNIGGMLLLGVGLLITIPVSELALAYVYRKLASQTGGGTSNVPAAFDSGGTVK